MTSRVYPSRAAERIVFRELFRNAATVQRNGGTLVGNPEVQSGVTLDGSTQYVTYPIAGIFDVSQFTIVQRIIPHFDWDADSNNYFWSSTSNSTFLFKRNNASNNDLVLQVNGTVIASIPAVTYSPYWRVNELNRLVVAVESGNTNAWLNNQQILTNDASTYTNQFNDALFIGANSSGASLFDGVVNSFDIHARLFTAEDVAKLEAGRLWSYPAEATLWLDMAEQTVREAIVRGTEELLVDGDMEAVGVAAWTAENSASISKETVDPQEGTQYLRIAYGGSSDPRVRQSVHVVGRRYRATGYARGDGSFAPELLQAGAVVWTGTASTSWQRFDVAYEATGAYVRLQSSATSAGWADFDDVSVQRTDELVSDGDMEATGVDEWTAGASATLTKSTAAPYQGTQSLSVAYNGTPFPYAYQSILTIGSMYHITGRMRGDGSSAYPRIRVGGAFGADGTTSTDWQEIDEYLIAADATFRMYQFTTGAGWVEFDNISVREVKQCTLDKSPAGHVALLGDGSLASTAAPAFQAPGFEFDGSNDYMQVSDVGPAFNHATFSVVAVIRPGYYPGSINRYLFDTSPSGSRCTAQASIDGGGRLYLYFGGTYLGFADPSSYLPYWAENGRNVFVFAAESTSVNVYLNGVLVHTATGAWTYGSPDDLFIGIGSSFSSAHIGGYNGFMVFKTKLSPLQIEDLMHSLGVTPWA